MGQSLEVVVDGREVRLTNLEKTFYPKSGFRKGDVINYYTRAAPWLLPHLRERPITLLRFPDGVEGESFYQKEVPAHRPRWVKTVEIHSDVRGRPIPFCVVNDLSTLLWLVNTGDLEFHPYLHTASHTDRPTCAVFDLDPGPGVDIVACCQVAHELRKLLDALGLKGFPKTSGGKGLQVYVPFNTPIMYEETKTFARELGLALQRQMPKLVVTSMRKELRAGRVLVDYSQNDRHKTTVCVHSMRGRADPTVSTPVTWEEVHRQWKSSKIRLVFGPEKALERLEDEGDLFSPVLTLKQKLPSG